MGKVFCFGELLLRYSPQLNGQWIHDAATAIYVGGAELNVATALALWQVPVSYCTALPDHYLSKEICLDLTQKNIDIHNIIWTGNRIGSYYLPQGVDMKNAGVIYDRAYSSFSQLQPGQINWHEVLKDVSWFHYSAISPALGSNIAAVCLEAVTVASEKGITISVDLNYRSKLWQYGKEPIAVMPQLVTYCDVVMGNLWAFEKMLGISIDADMRQEKEGFLKQAQKSSAAIMQQYDRCRQVASTFRMESANNLTYYAALCTHNNLYVSNEYFTQQVVDKVGSGDAFMAGLIYGNLQKRAPDEMLGFAAAAAFDKLFIKGDATTSKVEDIIKRWNRYE